MFVRQFPLKQFVQKLHECVCVRETRDEKFFQRDWLFIWFCHCASSFDHLVRQHDGRNLRMQATISYWLLVAFLMISSTLLPPILIGDSNIGDSNP